MHNTYLPALRAGKASDEKLNINELGPYMFNLWFMCMNCVGINECTFPSLLL